MQIIALFLILVLGAGSAMNYFTWRRPMMKRDELVKQLDATNAKLKEAGELLANTKRVRTENTNVLVNKVAELKSKKDKVETLIIEKDSLSNANKTLTLEIAEMQFNQTVKAAEVKRGTSFRPTTQPRK